jgi:hypothetical protein
MKYESLLKKNLAWYNRFTGSLRSLHFLLFDMEQMQIFLLSVFSYIKLRKTCWGFSFLCSSYYEIGSGKITVSILGIFRIVLKRVFAGPGTN